MQSNSVDGRALPAAVQHVLSEVLHQQPVPVAPPCRLHVSFGPVPLAEVRPCSRTERALCPVPSPVASLRAAPGSCCVRAALPLFIHHCPVLPAPGSGVRSRSRSSGLLPHKPHGPSGEDSLVRPRASYAKRTRPAETCGQPGARCYGSRPAKAGPKRSNCRSSEVWLCGLRRAAAEMTPFVLVCRSSVRLPPVPSGR